MQLVRAGFTLAVAWAAAAPATQAELFACVKPQNRGHAQVTKIITFKDNVSVANIKPEYSSWLECSGGAIVHDYKRINGMAVVLPAKVAEVLEDDERIDTIEDDTTVSIQG